jgi:hypothetical protein
MKEGGGRHIQRDGIRTIKNEISKGRIIRVGVVTLSDGT